MSFANRSQIDRLTKDIASLRKADAGEAKKEADLFAKINRANGAASRTRSTSTVQSKLKEAERATKDLANAQKKRADLAGKIADRAKSLRSYEERQARDDERDRKRIADEQKKLIRERESHERKLASAIRSTANALSPTMRISPPADDHDFFISHPLRKSQRCVADAARVRARHPLEVEADASSDCVEMP